MSKCTCSECERSRALARVEALHQPYKVYGEDCGHDHAEASDKEKDGLTFLGEFATWVCEDAYEVTVCSSCCFDEDGQTGHCASSHDHDEGKPICATVAALEEPR